MNNTVLERFIEKYGEADGPRKYRWANASKESFILRYGEIEGEKRYKLCQERKSNSLKNIPIERRNEIRRILSEKNKGKKAKWHSTLEDFVRKYGETLGTERYNTWLENVRKNTPRGPKIQQRQKYINSINWYIDKYGEEEGTVRYNNWKKSQDHGSLAFFTCKYGEEEGKRKYKEVNSTKHMKSFYSKISIECFENIIESLNLDKSNCKYGANELQLYYTLNKSRKKYCYDFCYQNKIIEFNGDRWHCNPKMYNYNYTNPKHKPAPQVWVNDDNKRKLAINRGYDIFVIWESDWVNNKEQVLEDVKKFINKE